LNYFKVIIKAAPSLDRINNVLLTLNRSTGEFLDPSPEAMAQLHLDVARYVEALTRCTSQLAVLLEKFRLGPLSAASPIPCGVDVGD